MTRATERGGIRNGRLSRSPVRPRIARFILSATLACAATGAGAAGLTLEESAKKLDSSIQTVMTCGHWEQGEERGRYRVIAGWLWGHSEIYIQWLADPIWYPKKGQTARHTPLVLKTAVIPELDAYEAATDLENISCVEREKGWTVEADAENGHEENAEKAKYRLVIELGERPGSLRVVKRRRSEASVH